MRDGVVGGPAREIGPSAGLVRPERAPGAQEVADDVAAPVGAVVARVAAERRGDPAAVERLAVDDAAARAQVRRDVDVVIREADDRAGPRGGRRQERRAQQTEDDDGPDQLIRSASSTMIPAGPRT
jgi:hypothetical protein